MSQNQYHGKRGMAEIVFSDGTVAAYNDGDLVRLTEAIVAGGATGRICEMGIYVNGEKTTGKWDVAPNATLLPETERGEFIYRKDSSKKIQCSYDMAGPGLSVLDIFMLKQMASLLPAGAICINIGANIGTSTLALLEDRRDAFIFSIDILPWDEEFDVLKAAGLCRLNRVVRVLGRSQDVGRNWPFPVDFVFVDGGHREKDVREDIAAWLPKLRENGILAFHDYGTWHTPGVKRAVDDLMNGYPVISHAGVIKAFRNVHSRIG